MFRERYKNGRALKWENVLSWDYCMVRGISSIKNSRSKESAALFLDNRIPFFAGEWKSIRDIMNPFFIFTYFVLKELKPNGWFFIYHKKVKVLILFNSENLFRNKRWTILLLLYVILNLFSIKIPFIFQSILELNIFALTKKQNIFL